jgi:hypothetical protein
VLPGVVTQKIGPLPAWAWGVLVGAGVLGFAYMRSRNSAAADQSAADAAAAGAGDTTGTAGDVTAGDLTGLDSTAPLSFAGPISGTSGVDGGVPQTTRLDPAQWARLEKEIRALRREERRDQQRNPKHKKHRNHGHAQAHADAQQTRARQRVEQGGASR